MFKQWDFFFSEYEFFVSYMQMNVYVYVYIIRKKYFELKHWLQANQNALFPTKFEIFYFIVNSG